MSDQPSIREHNQRLLDKLEPGDIVVFERRVYDHHAIYKGDGKVIHRAGDDGASGWSHHNSTCSGYGVLSDKSKIQEGDFWKVANGCRARNNNAELDCKYPPREPKDIIKAAEARIGKREGFNLFNNNCETFVNECRYGKSESAQGDLAELCLTAGVTTVVVWVAALIGRFVSRNRIEKNKTTQ
ncbi:phospholipase A and acyltransferase 3-like [Littorina saxatilis]|uniref:phospholipase A and acyltransferase 3-like n=1 Tax=Littorina saxatilis TaxID=31220 RepID=UPI0038B5925A